MSSAELLTTLLEPLLEDFQYWFGKSADLLGTTRLAFLTDGAQQDLLARVQSAQKGVETATMLFKLTDKQVGVDSLVVMDWHRLLMECQAVGMRYRQERQPEVS